MKTTFKNESAANYSLPNSFGPSVVLPPGGTYDATYSNMSANDRNRVINSAKKGDLSFPGNATTGIYAGFQVTPLITDVLNEQEPSSEGLPLPPAGSSVFSISDNANRLFNGYQWITDKHAGWIAHPSDPFQANQYTNIVATPDGKIYQIHGEGDTVGAPYPDCNVFDPTNNVWVPIAPMPTPTRRAFISVLNTGELFVAGGSTGFGGSPRGQITTTACWVYKPATDTWVAATALPTQLQTAGSYTTRVVTLDNGKVLIVGAWEGPIHTYTPSIHTYVYTPGASPNPQSGTWAASTNAGNGDVPAIRHYGELVKLPSGKAMYVGGSDDTDGVHSSSECTIYDPTPGTWSVTAPMPATTTDNVFDTDAVTDNPGSRVLHAVEVLNNGKVLVAGGTGIDFVTNGTLVPRKSALLYTPGSDTWKELPTMSVERLNPQIASTRQNSDEVIVTGDVLFGGDQTTDALVNNGRWFATAIAANGNYAPLFNIGCHTNAQTSNTRPIMIFYSYIDGSGLCLEYSPGQLPMPAQAARPSMTLIAAKAKMAAMQAKIAARA